MLKSLPEGSRLEKIETFRNVKSSCKLASIKGILTSGEESDSFRHKDQERLYDRSKVTLD